MRLDDTKQTQTIDPDIVQQLRDWRDGKISTGELGADLVAALREEWAHKNAWLENKVTEHDVAIKKHNGILAFVNRLGRGLTDKDKR